jgi:NADH-quinone oxidoreductase subunit N
MHWFLDMPHSLQAAAILSLFAVVVLLAAPRASLAALHRLTLLAPIAAALPVFVQRGPEAFPVLAVLALALIGALLLCTDALENHIHRGECGALLLLGTAGACVLATANNLLSILIGFESMSLAVAVMTGLGRGPRTLEVAFKFFALGAASVATMIYGIGLVAYAAGSFEIGAAPLAGLIGLHQAGLLLITLGITYELALVPIHFGTLGVYFAAPMSFAGFAMTVSKLGAALAVARIAAAHPHVQPMLVGLGVLSIVWATFGGLAQRHLRGLLAYSAVGHGGFLALSIGCGTDGRTAAVFYAIVYVASAALVAAALSGCEGDLPYAELRSKPLGKLRTAALVTGLLSLSGVPPSPGFWAKLAVLGPSWHVAGPLLTCLAVLGGVFGALYYLRPVPDLIAGLRGGERGTAASRSAGVAIALAGGAVVLFLVLPYVALRFAN